MIQFFVPGIPKTAGSKRAFMRPGMRFPVVVEDCKGSKDWRGDVKRFASEHCKSPLTGPLMVEFHFFMQRPKGHYGSGRNEDVVKASAPRSPAKKPDLLKLARAVEDALTGVAWKDDSQIVIEELSKAWSGKPGVFVKIEELDSP